MHCASSLIGTWTYRSFVSNTDINASFDSLEFGRATLRIDDAPLERLRGELYGTGWSLALVGSTTYGNPMELRFQGRGAIGGEEWVYDYLGYVIKPWPNGHGQIAAITGSIVRTAPHSDGSGGVAPAGVVAQWIAVKHR